MATKAKKQTGKIPAGFSPVEENKFPTNHDFRETPELIGKVMEIKKVPGRGKARRIMYVAANDTGEVTAVWENQMLENLFAQVKTGDEIYIKFEFTETESGRKKVSAFQTAIKH